MTASPPIAWSPQKGPQSDAYACAEFCSELLYGGAVFAAKTDFLIGDFAQDVGQGENWVGLLSRQTFPELEEIIERTQQIYPQMGAEYTAYTKTWRWPGGAILRLRSLDQYADFTKAWGFSYSWIGWDELGNHESLKLYKILKTRLRGPAKRKRIRASANPGGRCHGELKAYFGIDKHPRGRVLFTGDDTSDPDDVNDGMQRMFIPGRAEDNKIGLAGDPGYLQRLDGIGDPELVKGLKLGDWDAIVGNYFSMFRKGECEVEPADHFMIPPTWSVFACYDYGESNPTWCGLLAVDYDDDVWVIDEYYLGGEVSGAEHARAVRALIDNCPFLTAEPQLHLAPGDMWTKRRPGEASQARAPVDSFADQDIYLTRANMERVNGWRNIKDMLYAGRLKFFRGRTDHICSSLASVVRDPNNPEDVLKGGDDHPADGLRYGINHVYRPRQLANKPPEGPNMGHTVLQMLEDMGRPKGRYG